MLNKTMTATHRTSRVRREHCSPKRREGGNKEGREETRAEGGGSGGKVGEGLQKGMEEGRRPGEAKWR